MIETEENDLVYDLILSVLLLILIEVLMLNDGLCKKSILIKKGL